MIPGHVHSADISSASLSNFISGWLTEGFNKVSMHRLLFKHNIKFAHKTCHKGRSPSFYRTLAYWWTILI